MPAGLTPFPHLAFGNATGNEVTGDGTSTATCEGGTADDTGYFETQSA
jgi:hypothetical protein